jgi:hypothetical protein
MLLERASINYNLWKGGRTMSYNQPWYQQQWQQVQQQSRFMNQMQDANRHHRQQHLDMIQRGQEINRRATAMRRNRNAPISGVEKLFGLIVWLAVMAFIVALFVANI